MIVDDLVQTGGTLINCAKVLSLFDSSLSLSLIHKFVSYLIVVIICVSLILPYTKCTCHVLNFNMLVSTCIHTAMMCAVQKFSTQC